MKKILLILFIVLFKANFCFSQNLNSRVITTEGAPSLTDLELPGGNGTSSNEFVFEVNNKLYTVGTYQNSIEVGSTTLKGKGLHTYFLTEYDASGNILSATNFMDSDHNDVTIENLIIANNKIIVSGIMEAATIYMKNNTFVSNESQAFLASFELNGNNSWMTEEPRPDPGTSIISRNDSILFNNGDTNLEIYHSNGDKISSINLEHSVSLKDMTLDGDNLIFIGQTNGYINFGDVFYDEHHSIPPIFIASFNLKTLKYNWVKLSKDTEFMIPSRVTINSNNQIIYFHTTNPGGGWNDNNILNSNGYVASYFNTSGGYITSNEFDDQYHHAQTSILNIQTTSAATYAIIKYSKKVYRFDSNFMFSKLDYANIGDISLNNLTTENDKLIVAGILVTDALLFKSNENVDSPIFQTTAAGQSGNTKITDVEHVGSSDFYLSEHLGKSKWNTQEYNNKESTILVSHKNKNQLIWSQSIKNANLSYSYYGPQLAIDSTNHNAILIGYSAQEIEINNNKINNSGLFLTSLDYTSDEYWTLSLKGALSANISCDKKGDIFVTGIYSDKISIAATSIDSPGLQKSFYVAKLNKTGQVMWLKNINLNSLSGYNSILSAGSNSITLTAEIDMADETEEYSIKVFGKDYSLNRLNDGRNIILNFDSNGNINWLKTFGRAPEDDSSDFFTWGQLIHQTNNGIYLIGGHGKNVFIGSTNLNSTLSYNTFIAKYDLDGNSLWAKSIQLGNFSGYSGIDFDKMDNLYLHSTVYKSATIDGLKFDAYSSFGAITTKFNSNGDFQWAYYLDMNSRGSDIAVIEEDYLITTGTLTGEFTTDDDTYRAYGGRSYILTFGNASFLTGVEDALNDKAAKAYPNPFNNSIKLEGLNFGNEPCEISLIDLSGKTYFKQTLTLTKDGFNTLDFNNIKPGTYILSVKNSREQFSQMIIKE